MSDLDRLVALAGLATDDVAQGATNETTIEESDCDCDCGKSPCESCGEDHHDVKEAVGEAAELFYEMQDMYAGGECPSKPHETIIDELVRYLSGDQVEDFVMEFRRHHMDLGDEMFKDDVNIDEGSMSDIDAEAQEFALDAIENAKHIQNDNYYFSDSSYYEFTDGLDTDNEALMSHPLVQQILRALPNVDMDDEEIKQAVDALANMQMNEDDLDENAFNQAAAAAARAGKEEFEFGGKTYKTKMDKSTAHKLDDDVQFESDESITEAPYQYDMSDKGDMHDALGAVQNSMDDAVKSIQKAAGIASQVSDEIENSLYTDESVEEVVAEAPTMDTTQLITLLKNAGLSEEAIEKKLTEWANTPAPEMASEQEPTEHGDAYDFAQGVNLSLKRYLDAEDMKVGLKEHTVEELKAAYKASKDEG